MTALLSWQRIGNRQSWASQVDTRSSSGTVVETTSRTAQSADMVEDLPRLLVDAYARRAVTHAVLQQVDPGVLVASVAGLEGAYGEGGTPAEALDDLLAAVTGWVAVKRRHGQHIPPLDGLDLNLGSPSSSAA
jgi:predicted RNase H-like HicB family nuclease